MEYKLIGTKYWKPHFNDLGCFDRVGLHELLYRVEKTFADFGDLHENGKLVYYKDEYNDIPEMNDLYKKFNKDNDHIDKQVGFWPEGKPLFRHKYNNDLIDSTCNYQFRDGIVKSPFEHLDLYTNHFLQVENNLIEKDYLYLSIPHKFILDYLEKTNNNWIMEIPRLFISKIKDWSNVEEVDSEIDKFDKKYPNWNHDFPIMSYMSILKNGLLFPNTTFKLNSILTTGTHRLFMCGMSGNDYPMFIPIPKGKKEFKVKTLRPIFKGNTDLILKINLNKKQYELFLDDKKIGEVKV
tara:strand:- start:173 stop:1057 length:885 start_codon:yes stop_codon:yes gene_type:complete